MRVARLTRNAYLAPEEGAPMWDALARYRALILVGALLIAPPILLWGQTRAPNARGPIVGLIIELASWIERPLLAVSGVISDGLTVYVGSVASAEELIRLRRNQNELVAAKNRIRELERENDALRHLAQAAQRIDGPRPLGARIIGRTGAPLTRLARIDRGKADGIRKGDGVITLAGVVGQILSVGRHTSDILLMTDPLSALDVVVQRTRARGIIRGSGLEDSYRARVEDFDRLEDVQAGDSLVTSALTSHFPPGILVGEIREVSSRADSVYRRAEVVPAVEMAALEHVLVLIGRRPERLPQLGNGAQDLREAPGLNEERGEALSASGRAIHAPVAEWATLEVSKDTAVPSALIDGDDASRARSPIAVVEGQGPATIEVPAGSAAVGQPNADRAPANVDAKAAALNEVLTTERPISVADAQIGSSAPVPAESRANAPSVEDLSEAFPPYYEQEMPRGPEAEGAEPKRAASVALDAVRAADGVVEKTPGADLSVESSSANDETPEQQKPNDAADEVEEDGSKDNLKKTEQESPTAANPVPEAPANDENPSAEAEPSPRIPEEGTPEQERDGAASGGDAAPTEDNASEPDVVPGAKSPPAPEEKPVPPADGEDKPAKGAEPAPPPPTPEASKDEAASAAPDMKEDSAFLNREVESSKVRISRDSTMTEREGDAG